jgi:hypothetical protein
MEVQLQFQHSPNDIFCGPSLPDTGLTPNTFFFSCNVITTVLPPHVFVTGTTYFSAISSIAKEHTEAINKHISES